jgi:hypothetical protein
MRGDESISETGSFMRHLAHYRVAAGMASGLMLLSSDAVQPPSLEQLHIQGCMVLGL